MAIHEIQNKSLNSAHKKKNNMKSRSSYGSDEQFAFLQV